MQRHLQGLMAAVALAFAACSTTPPTTRPASWDAPEALVAPSSFTGVHGLAIDTKGRLLAGSVLGNSIWEVDRNNGAAKILIVGPEGQADDIAVGPKGELAWTNYLMGMVRMRDSDDAPIRVVAENLPGLNSLDFDRRNGRLFATQVFMGDALWELDLAGVKPRRLIARNLSGLNGFEVGPDGMTCGPLWFKNSVARIDPANGAVTVINGEFKTPAAAKFSSGRLFFLICPPTNKLQWGYVLDRQPRFHYTLSYQASCYLSC